MAPGPARTDVWPSGPAHRESLPPAPASGPAHRKTLPPAPAAPLALPAAFSKTQQKPERGDVPLAPWELSPDDYAAAAPQEDTGPWRISNTGPMYVWNPNAATGPLPVLGDDRTEPDDTEPDDGTET